MSRLWGALIVGLVLVVAGPVVADTPEDVAVARALVSKGNARFQLGDFEEALKFYKQAYDKRPTPNTLFNIAQCYRQLKMGEKALFSFRQYLAFAPTAPNRADVEAIIAELEAEQARSKGSAAAPNLLPKPTEASGVAVTANSGDQPPSKPWYRRWYVWGGIGAVVVGAVVTGVVLGTSSSSAKAPRTDFGNMHVLGALR